MQVMDNLKVMRYPRIGEGDVNHRGCLCLEVEAEGWQADATMGTDSNLLSITCISSFRKFRFDSATDGTRHAPLGVSREM